MQRPGRATGAVQEIGTGGHSNVTAKHQCRLNGDAITDRAIGTATACRWKEHLRGKRTSAGVENKTRSSSVCGGPW